MCHTLLLNQAARMRSHGTRYRYHEAHFSDKSELPLKPGSITVITGPNNAGKSTSLRDIDKHFSSGRGRAGYTGRVVRQVETELVGSASDFFEFFEALNYYDKEEDRYRFDHGYSKNGYKTSTLRKAITNNNLPNPVEATFSKFLPASERLSGTGYNDSVNHAVNQIFSNEPKEIALSDIFRRSFGIDLILDRTRKEGVFYIAERSDLPSHEERLTPEFRKWMEKQATLRSQGDGMRSFARVLIEIFVRRLSILAIDEPELFLHPPQIRQLAAALVRERPVHSQVFVATHSDEFVKGILDTQPDDINFIRLTRSKEGASVKYLRHDDVATLWSDPLLRTSNALSSLFHQFTIVCEGETDARFLRWALDDEMSDDLSIDYFITHCGGKQKIHGIVKAISAIGANVFSVCDIDVLNDKVSFQRLFEAHGGDYSKVAQDHKLILTRVSERKSEISPHYFWSEIERLKAATGQSENIKKDTTDQIATLIRRSSPWGRIKEDGKRAFVDAESIRAFDRIRKAAASYGLFINPEGELESLCRTISRANKANWLTEVLQLDYKKAADLVGARELVKEVSNYMRANADKVF
ncbi:ATP-dependent nuclease [Roseovarius aquimarinus]|uniref:ATP-dependent endonuclease n=1 Tax=Roseovarius aquimarinus TaxID=1229156 RepID=A0ABW7I281_9RHOB